MPHFFIQTSDISDDEIKVRDKSVLHHLVRVLRIKEGEELLLTDENQTRYKTIVERVENACVSAKILEKTKSEHSLKLNLYLAQGVLKNDAQNLVIQKATELGVKGIIPLDCKNSVVKASVIDTKIEKWSKIAFEAVKQCERTDLPQIYPRCSLKKILEDESFKYKIACVERSQKEFLKNYLRQINPESEDKILVIIGPEGGFAQEETDLMERSDAVKVSLGKLILRAETAVVSALSNVIYELENE